MAKKEEKNNQQENSKFISAEELIKKFKQLKIEEVEIIKRRSFFGKRMFLEVIANNKSFRIGEFSHFEIKGMNNDNVQKYAEEKEKLFDTALNYEDKLRKAGISVELGAGLLDSLEKLTASKLVKRNIYATLGVAGLLGGLFFLSTNITGNVIGNFDTSTSSTFGIILVIVGLLCGFMWLES
jgi:hypothetical protein